MTDLPPLTGDFHGWTAANDETFRARMASEFGVDWESKMEGKVIRQFAKAWNMTRLYGGTPMTLKRLTMQDGIDTLNRALTSRGIANEPVALGEVETADLSGTLGAPGTIGTDPPSHVAPRTTEGPAVWASVPVAMRQWTNGGLKSIVCTHVDMASIIIPIEVFYTLAKGYSLEKAQFEPGADDTVSEAIADEYHVRPDAVMQATDIAQYVINAFPR